MLMGVLSHCFNKLRLFGDQLLWVKVMMLVVFGYIWVVDLACFRAFGTRLQFVLSHFLSNG